MDDTTERTRAVARRYMEAVAAGDAAAMDRLQHRDATWWVLGGGTMTREQFMGLVADMFANVISRTITVKGIIVEGDRAAIELDGEMQFHDRIYRNSYHNVLIIRDGLIAEGREYMDTQAAASAFAK